MLTLQALPPIDDQPSASPFVVKIMCLLTMAGLDWRADYKANLRKTPKGKVPVLIDGEKVIDDSSVIRQHLEAQHGAAFEARLSDAEKAAAHALTRMVEEHLYFAAVYNRWVVDVNWRHLKAVFFSDMPPVVKQIAPGLIRREILKSLHGQGMGRFSEEEAAARVMSDLAALKTHLGESPFLFGDTPSAADASAAPVLASLASAPYATRLSRLVSEAPVLTDYIARTRDAIYPKTITS